MNRTRPFIAALAATALLAAGGCQSITGQQAGGRMASLDQYTYESTQYLPQTVTVVDLRDGQELWSMDVPVGYKLITRFYDNKSDNPAYPDIMRWAVVPLTRKSTLLENKIPMPDSGARRIEVAYREGPEDTPDIANPPADPFVRAPATTQGLGG